MTVLPDCFAMAPIKKRRASSPLFFAGLLRNGAYKKTPGIEHSVFCQIASQWRN